MYGVLVWQAKVPPCLQLHGQQLVTCLGCVCLRDPAVQIQSICDGHKNRQAASVFRLWPAREQPGSPLRDKAAHWAGRLKPLVAFNGGERGQSKKEPVEG